MCTLQFSLVYLKVIKVNYPNCNNILVMHNFYKVASIFCKMDAFQIVGQYCL